MARDLPVHATHALLVTPFTSEQDLDHASTRSLVDFVLDNGAEASSRWAPPESSSPCARMNGWR